MSINYSERIPNNVNLAEDRTLQRALEQWQPNYLQWWADMGPDGSQDFDVYLRTAVSVDPQGWAQFGYVKMPDYRWGIFLNPGEKDRKIHFGDHLGEDKLVQSTALIDLGGDGNVLLNVGPFGTVQISASPNASDKIVGPDLTTSDNNDLINTLATACRGDFVHLKNGHTDGAIVHGIKGTWAIEG